MVKLKMGELVATVGIGLIKIGVYIYDFITLPIYTLVQLPWQTVNPDAAHKTSLRPVSEGLCYSSTKPLLAAQVEMKRNNIDTVQKAHKYAFKRYQNQKSIGTRDVLSEFQEAQPNGKVFIKNDLGDYQWKTYGDVDKLSSKLGCGFRKLGFAPNKNIMVLSETRAEWFITSAAAFKHNIPICTLYATLGYDGLIHGINETETEVLVTSHDMMPKVKAILESCKLLKTIVYFPDQLQKTSTEGFGDIKILSFQEVIDLGQTCDIPECPPTPDDIAFIMYTSGSTGTPKGVILSHRNLITAVIFYMGSIDPIPNELFMAYLPLAHVLELMAENLMFVMGVPMGYSSPLTMTDRSTKVKRGCNGDISMLQPTLITAVPLVLDRMYKGILEKVASQGTFLKFLFKYGVDYKVKWSNWGFNTPICDWFVFRKVRALLGGNLRLIATGGAPLSGETHTFIRAALGIPVVQGYGLTETCGCSNVMLQTNRAVCQVGPPVMGSDVKLVDWEEGCYYITDKPNPRGEIVIGGDHVAIGYYKNPKKTNEEFFDEDGRRWFRTGDIGMYMPNGSLKVIDRKKDLVKLQFGEYVSLAKVENALSSSPLVENICVYGESNKNNVVAIITPDCNRLTEIANSLHKSNMSFEGLCKDKDITKYFLDIMVQNGRKAKLEKFELPTALYLSPEQWTPDTGLVTAAFKLKRVEIKKHYQEAINHMYGA